MIGAHHDTAGHTRNAILCFHPLTRFFSCPEHLYKKAPTADLEDDRPSLPDEVALGVTYDNIDDYLEGKNVPEQVARTIENWYLKTEHKRRPPITVFDDFWKK